MPTTMDIVSLDPARAVPSFNVPWRRALTNLGFTHWRSDVTHVGTVWATFEVFRDRDDYAIYYPAIPELHIPEALYLYMKQAQIEDRLTAAKQVLRQGVTTLHAEREQLN